MLNSHFSPGFAPHVGQRTEMADLFLASMGVLSTAGPALSFAHTDAKALYGDLDVSAAAPLGSKWTTLITLDSDMHHTPVSCVYDAGHRIPDILDGAAMIAADLATKCVSQP